MKSKNQLISKITPRLILRPLMEGDYDNWAQAYSCQLPAQNDWDETNWKSSELTKAKFKSHLKIQKENRTKDRFYSFGIFRKDDGILLGHVDLMDISRGPFQNAYLGYRIFNNYWGQGYAQESCKAVVKIAFRELNLHRVEAGIAPKNKKSIRVAKSIGLSKEGLSPKRIFIHNKWTDLVLYAATSEDFRIKYSFKK